MGITSFHFKMDKFLKVEGILIENKALSNLELIEYIKKLKIKNFRGVFMRDNLKKKKRRAECGNVNLADSLSDGTHWVCYYIFSAQEQTMY